VKAAGSAAAWHKARGCCVGMGGGRGAQKNRKQRVVTLLHRRQRPRYASPGERNVTPKECLMGRVEN